MLVMLDATELVSDPMCGGIAWRVLAHRVRTWRVDLMTTEVVFAEAEAGFLRRCDEAIVGLERWRARHAASLGFGPIADDARAAIADVNSAYAGKLRDRLSAAGVKVIPSENVPHMELVKRATLRRKPCDKEGNGYRDTLNWLTLLSVAKANPDQEVIWVSGNTRDFADEDCGGLHPELVDELATMGISNVRWLPSLQGLALEIASTFSSGKEPDLAAVENRLRDNTIAEFVFKHITETLPYGPLDVRACGLPLEADAAMMDGCGYPPTVTVEVKGVPGDETVVEFKAEVCGLIRVTPRPGKSIQGQDAFGSPDDDSTAMLIEKSLVFSGIMSLGDYGRPTAIEVAAVEAMPDDPGRVAWLMRDAAARVDRKFQDVRTLQSFSGLTSNFQESIKQMQSPGRAAALQEAIKNLRLPMFQGGTERHRPSGSGRGGDADEEAQRDQDDGDSGPGAATDSAREE